MDDAVATFSGVDGYSMRQVLAAPIVVTIDLLM
jgi:hypothetical protein